MTCEFQLVSSHHGSHSPHAFFSRSQPRVQLISLFGLFSRGQSVQVGSEGQCSWGLAVSNLHLNIIVIITSSRPVRVDQGWHALRVQNHGWMVVGIVIVDSVGRASVRLFRVCVPHGTFGDMNGEYRSPGPATLGHGGRAPSSVVPTKVGRFSDRKPKPGPIPSGDQATTSSAVGMRWNSTLEPRQVFFLETPTPEFGLSDGRLDATV